MARESRTKKKSDKAAALTFIVLLVVIVLVVLFFNAQSGFMDNLLQQAAQTRTAENISASVAVNMDAATQYKAYKNSVILCDSQGLRSVGVDGNIEWNVDMNLKLPMLSVADKYILAADRSGKDVTVFNAGKIVNASKTDSGILSAKMEASGNYVLITEEPYYKGKVLVRNLRGEDIFAWYSGNSYIVDADISQDGKRLAVATLNTVGKIAANILLFDTTQTEPYKTIEMEGSAVTNINFTSDGRISVIADNKAMEISASGNTEWTFEYSDKVLERAYLSQSNNVVLALAESVGSNTTVVVLDRKGKQKGSIVLNNAIRYLDISGDMITYNDRDAIIVASMTGKMLYNIETQKDIRKVIFFPQGRHLLGITSVSLDVIEIK